MVVGFVLMLKLQLTYCRENQGVRLPSEYTGGGRKLLADGDKHLVGLILVGENSVPGGSGCWHAPAPLVRSGITRVPAGEARQCAIHAW